MSKKAKENIKDILEILIWAAVLAFIILAFIKPCLVDGSSMYPTLKDKDFVIAWRYGNIEKDDIVVFDAPDRSGREFIKRVIAVEGDHLVIHGNTVVVNDVTLNETYINEAEFSSPDIDIVVPQGKIFVLGDNRNHSTDGRVFGCIDKESVSGKIIFNFNGLFR